MGESRLIEAVRATEDHRVDELLAAGADPHERDEHGWTPLNWAAGKGNLEMVRRLLAAGASPFETGRDQRTPYMIALAAGHREIAKELRNAEDVSGMGKSSRVERPYCRAYELGELRRFPGWSEVRLNWKSANGSRPPEKFDDDAVVFVHRDLTVTESMWHDENILFNEVTPAWQQYCTENLAFHAPDDLDLVVRVEATIE